MSPETVDKSALLDVLERLAGECESALGQASSLEDVEALRVEFLGRKGRLAQAMSAMAQLPASDKPEVGKAANTAKGRLTEVLDGALEARKRAAAAAAFADFDPTVPGRPPMQGSRITSYNVCYTKLLRCNWPAEGPCAGAARPRGPGHVITSYSIHYTKLYEATRRQRAATRPTAWGAANGPWTPPATWPRPTRTRNNFV